MFGRVMAIAILSALFVIRTADAKMVIQVATGNVVGCFTKQDLLEVMKAATMTTMDWSAPAAKANQVINTKVATGRCFPISSGQSVLGAPEWQNATDAFSGILVFKMMVGDMFYSVAWAWRFGGDLPDYVQAPR